MIEVHVLPMGDAALLLEVADSASVLALHETVRGRVDHANGSEDPWGCVLDLVPAARTLLLHTFPDADLTQLGRAAFDLAATLDPPDDNEAHDDCNAQDSEAEVVEIPVTYDGEDLDDVAQATGMSRDEVIDAHAASTWRVAFFGFAPGFAYLSGGDPRLQVARRSEPRTTVPPGSVGLAGEFSAVYPRKSPGGWQLIGTTESLMWDEERDPPSLLQPGSTVRFVHNDSGSKDPA